MGYIDNKRGIHSMIDLHSHILPSLDDGAVDEAQSIEMMRAAIDEGITIVAATPHHQNGEYNNEREVILAGVKRLNDLAEEHQLNIKIVPGQEIRLYGEIERDYEDQKLVTIGDNTRYILIEFSNRHVPRYTEQLFYDLQLQGLKPIIVHPERNLEIMASPEKLMKLIEKGALVQVTAGSITGHFGKKIQKFTHELINTNAFHIIASDAHNISNRGFHMKGAVQALEKKYGAEYVEYLQSNARDILADKAINPWQTTVVKRKKLFGIF